MELLAWNYWHGITGMELRLRGQDFVKTVIKQLQINVIASVLIHKRVLECLSADLREGIR